MTHFRASVNPFVKTPVQRLEHQGIRPKAQGLTTSEAHKQHRNDGYPAGRDSNVSPACPELRFDAGFAQRRPEIQVFGMLFLNHYPNINFTIEGHCDERGSAEYRWRWATIVRRRCRMHLVTTNSGKSPATCKHFSFISSTAGPSDCPSSDCGSRNLRTHRPKHSCLRTARKASSWILETSATRCCVDWQKNWSCPS